MVGRLAVGVTVVVSSFWFGAAAGGAEGAGAGAEVVEVRKIWDAARHNAFTDLVRWRDQWWCGFREADGHVGPTPGKLRVIRSADGVAWASAALIAEDEIDLRDPKLSVTPDGRLMMVAGGSVYEAGKRLTGRQPRVMFSTDGTTWTPPRRVLGAWDWLWRVTWHDGVAYGAAYNTGGDAPATARAGSNANAKPDWSLTLYRSRDGVAWERVAPLGVPDHPNETTLRFAADGTMLALARREAGDKLGWVGSAEPPYAEWTWRPASHRLGGPNFVQLPDGRWVAGTRDYTQSPTRTTIALLSVEDGKLAPLATLPSGGDNSYPGLVWHDGLLWVSYYASHEGRTAIYLAKLKLPAARK